ncbi:MAG: hypothetical protein U0228_23950 [Myxococcaceae bacterium]
MSPLLDDPFQISVSPGRRRQSVSAPRQRRHGPKWWAALASSLVLLACPPPTPAPGDAGDDAGAPDASVLDPDAGTPDASVPDLDAGPGLVDWRSVRGAPWTVSPSLGSFAGAPFALSSSRFALERCDDGGACSWEWRDLQTGAVTATVADQRSLFSSLVSPDGTLLSSFTVKATSSCASGGAVMPVYTTDWNVVRTDDGALTTLAHDFVTTEFVDPAFLSSRWARAYPVDASACSWGDAELRATTPPWDAPRTRLPNAHYVETELADGRFLVTSPQEQVYVAHPDDPADVDVITNQYTTLGHGGPFVHVFSGLFVREVVSYEVATGVTRRTANDLTQADWLAEFSSDRFAVVCTVEDPQRVRTCRAIDGRGELPVATWRTARFNGARTQALAGRVGVVVYLDERGVLVRRNLLDGREDVLDVPVGRLRVVADGQGVVLATDDAFFAIDAEQVTRIEGRRAGFLESRANGSVLFVTTSPSGGENWLTAWHVPGRRLARLTDSLNYNPPFNAPLEADGVCNAPGVVRHAGRPRDSAAQPATWLHFTEFVPQASPRLRVFVVPVDLHTPPRLVLETVPDRCGTPLASRGGETLWLPLPGTGAGEVELVVARTP